MIELRKDYILDRYVIIASDRSKRPNAFKKKDDEKKESTCFFCPENEHTTPPETYRVEKDGKWKIRCFPNKFPVIPEKPSKEKKEQFFHNESIYGNHEILVETPDHDKQMWDLSLEEIEDILKTYVHRIKELNNKYVLVFKNHGADAGASLHHAHTQIISYNHVPPLVKEEVDAVKKYKKCPYCDILKKESKGPRRAFENNTFVAFAPYASRSIYEIWILPKKHIKSIVELDNFHDLASILKKILLKLKSLNAPYNFFIHNSPKGSDLHFHIEILPKLSKYAGFELATNTIINIVSPEQAAEFYRG